MAKRKAAFELGVEFSIERGCFGDDIGSYNSDEEDYISNQETKKTSSLVVESNVEKDFAKNEIEDGSDEDDSDEDGSDEDEKEIEDDSDEDGKEIEDDSDEDEKDSEDDSDEDEKEIEDDSDDEDYNPIHESKRLKSIVESNENPISIAMRKCHQISIRIQSALLASRMAMLNPIQNAVGVHKFVLKSVINASCGIPESDLSRELKPYQISGINFLLLLHRLQVRGGILADEMGLGKTIQVIAFLAVLKNVEKNPGPHLIVAPVSVLENWRQEIARWCPSFKVVVFHEKTREGLSKQHVLVDEKGEPASFHILITSYSIFEKKSGQMKEDRNFLRKWKWNCVIMDEGHVLKDVSSMRSQKLQEIVHKAEQCIMLTGTPVQNDLQELWALLSFMMPETFNSCGRKNLQEFFGARNHGIQDQLIISNMQSLLKPFVMRRTKSESSWQLPLKSHRVLKLKMVGDQAQAYQEAVSEWQNYAKSKCTSQGINITNPNFSKSSQIQKAITQQEIRNSFTQLRKISNHPLLVRRFYKKEDVKKLAKRFHKLGVFGNQCTQNQVYDKLLSHSDFFLHKMCEEYGDIPNGQGKLDHELILSATKTQALTKLLEELKRQGHRCLIYSQWTKVLDILEWVLGFHGYNFLRLDGSTDVQTRQDLVDKFNNNEDVFIFLVSTRAGGQGLNLTGADTVIIHDVDFNPQLDRQAEDRCHRIGQRKPVTVYRLVASGSVDEAIYKTAQNKLNLDATVLHTKFIQDEDELEAMHRILLDTIPH